MDALTFVAGLAILGVVLWDIFQSIVVPRPTPGRIRISRYVVPPAWRGWRALGQRKRTPEARDSFLGLFAPGATVLLFAMWLGLIVIADGLLLYALRAERVTTRTSRR